jgi:hypothetical protein
MTRHYVSVLEMKGTFNWAWKCLFSMPFGGEAMYLRNRRMSFFAMPLAGLARAAQGQALWCFDYCPEKQDESNPHGIGPGTIHPVFRDLAIEFILCIF